MKVSELEGVKLDYWVARANGDFPQVSPNEIESYCFPPYSSDWSEGGPIIDAHQISLIKEQQCQEWQACINPVVDIHAFNDGGGVVDPDVWLGGTHLQFGNTALIAAMRCFVSSKFGEEVDDRQAHHI